MTNSYEKLITYALKIISKKRYTVSEIDKKLRKMIVKYELEVEDENEIVERVIVRLRELNYLNDEKYVADFISDRVTFRPRGKYLIKNELRKKGIPKEILELTFQKTNIDEESMILELLRKRMPKWTDLPVFKQKIKAYQYLSSRGFEKDNIYKAVSRCYNFNIEQDLN